MKLQSKWILIALLHSLGAQAELDPQALLAASDAIRNPERPYSVNTSLTEYRGGRKTDASQLTVYAKADGTTGQFKSLVRFIAPARDVDKLMLKNGNELWFYDPASKAAIRISPQQRLLGQAANGDVVTVNLSKDYKAALDEEESIEDGDRAMRRAYKLKLVAISQDVTYSQIELWLDANSHQSIKAKFYSESGRLLKTAFYRRYAQELGRERSTETVIIDGLDSQWVTVMRFSKYQEQEIPEEWMQRDYLPKFSGR